MSKINFKIWLNHKHFLIIISILLFVFALFLIVGYQFQKQLIEIYEKQRSLVTRDRKGEIIYIKPNQKGYWTEYLEEIPSRFKELLFKKEDEYFYYHFGFNPWSIFRASLGYLGFGPKGGSSTISQQSVKILLGKEFERNLKNKIIESFYTLGLELYQSKETILKMYVNSVYFGNQVQGLAEASQVYFNVLPEMLTDGQILQLLATISSPSKNNPAQLKNQEIALGVAQRLGLNNQVLVTTDPTIVKKNMQKYSHSGKSSFELRTLIDDSSKTHQLTIDNELSEKIRQIVDRNIEKLKPRDVRNAALVVIKLPENEILTLIGSPDPNYFAEGYQINMLNQPRPIGSTIKPFIYLKAFEKDLRPYTLVNDKEYKYITAIGFPLYPKNFDYKYRGEVSLHYALSNSLNVPSLKVLEYVGLEDFYDFLEEDLEFKPVQNLDNYQLGIALGDLEMSLWDLAKYFTIFPNNGVLKDLKIFFTRESENSYFEKKIADPKYIQLVNKILNDRKTGIEQFGMVSEFNLFQENYALKTGTSRNFHDSWVVGYTPDFLVGVWLGNADNSPMDGVSGQIGAGRIWAEIMELLFHSDYNKKTPFNFNLVKEFYQNNNIEYGLPNDNYGNVLNLLKEKDSTLILNPHQGDVFLLEENTKIVLKAKENVKWFINEEFLGEGESILFIPQTTGKNQIKVENSNGIEEIIDVYIQKVD